MDYQIIVDKILKLIDGSNINQFCKNVGLNQSNTNKFLKGKKYSISLDDLSKIANYYNLSLDYFFDKQPQIHEATSNDGVDLGRSMDYRIVADKIKMLLGNKSVNQFCKDIGLHQGNTSSFLNGKKYSISFDDLVLIADYFNISLDYFLNRSPLNDSKLKTESYAMVAYYDVRASAGGGELVNDENQSFMPVSKDIISRMGYNAKDILILQVSGDSMEPTLKDGDFVFMLNPEINYSFIPRIYIVRDVNNGVKIKRLDTDKYGNLIVKSDNPHYDSITYTKEDIDNGLLTIIGPVVGKFTTA